MSAREHCRAPEASDPSTRACRACGTLLPRLASTNKVYCDDVCGEAYRSRDAGVVADASSVARSEAEIGSRALLTRLLRYYIRHDALPVTLPYARFRVLAADCGIVLGTRTP